MPKYNFLVNGEKRTIDVDDPQTPVLWVLRDDLGLTGTKFSCGEGYCGSCTIHLDGEAVRSCSTFISEVEGKSVTTIEGLAKDKTNPILKAWIDEEVPQCGYCQPGQIMTVAAMLKDNKKPDKEEIDSIMSQILCRCGTYPRIKKAIEKVINEGGE